MTTNTATIQSIDGGQGCAVKLPFELTNGNDGRGNRWFSSAKLRKRFERDLRIMGLAMKNPLRFPVVVHVTRILGHGQRLWDSSSIGRGNWKEIEDALVAVGWFHDDGPKWIRETRFFQGGREEKPAVLVEVFRADDARQVREELQRLKAEAVHACP